MALTGTNGSTFIKDGYIPQVQKTFFRNTWWGNPANHPFEIVTNGPGGGTINNLINYSTTSNSAAHVKGQPYPSPDAMLTINSYFTKDYFEGVAKVSGQDLANLANGGSEVPVDLEMAAIEDTLGNVEAAMNAQFLTDLAAQVDATTAYSDASLARATYSLASIETAQGGALTLAVMEDTQESLRNTTYGIIPMSDIAICVPPNQLTNFSRLTSFDGSGAAWQSQGMDDPGRQFNFKVFNGSPVISVPGMTSTEIYFLRISTTKVYAHKSPEFKPIELNEWANGHHIVIGGNLVVKDPRRCAKITGVTE